jgi:hypothetical protein
MRLRELIKISFLIQGGKDVSDYTKSQLDAAKTMYDYVYKESGAFTCTYKYLDTLWLAAYFKVAGYRGSY